MLVKGGIIGMLSSNWLSILRSMKMINLRVKWYNSQKHLEVSESYSISWGGYSSTSW